MIPSGKISSNASGPTGSCVAGFKGGVSSNGRSGTMLYQLSGNAFSSSRNLVGSIQNLRSLAGQFYSFSLQPPAPPRRHCRPSWPLVTRWEVGPDENGFAVPDVGI